MKTISEAVGKIGNTWLFHLLLPAPLILAPTLWILAYYLRIHESQAAYVANIGLRAAVAVFFLIFGAAMVIAEPRGGPVRRVVLLITSFFAVCFAVAIAMQGLNPELKKVIGQFFLNAFPAFIVGVYCCRHEAGDMLLRGIEKYGLIIMPAAIIYVSRFFLFPGEVYTANLQRLGRIDYMGLSYAFMPLMIASCLLLFEKQANARIRLGRWLLVGVYWTAIVFTQTRGAVLGIGIFLLCLTVIKYRDNRKSALLLSSFCAIVFIAILQVLPSVFGTRNVRFSEANLDEALVFSGERAQWRERTEGYQFLLDDEDDGISEANRDNARVFSGDRAKRRGPTEGYQFLLDNEDNGVFLDKPKNLCTIHNREIAKRLATDEKLYELLSRSGCTIKLSRMALIEVSLEEIKKHPVTGMGPFAFQVRYFGFHPHNLLLELVVELGLLVGGTIVLAICILAYLFAVRSKGNTSHQNMLLFAAAYIPLFLVSGTIWGDAMFSFVLGYALVFCWMSLSQRSTDGPR